MQATTLLDSAPLSVYDFRCDAGPGARPFVEQHSTYAISIVRKGSFGYGIGGKTHEMVAGSVLVGYPGDEYVCTHEHVCGDQCLSFKPSAELAEAVGADDQVWRSGALPPLAELMVLAELAQSA